MRYVFNFRDIWAHQAYIIEGIGVTLVLSLVTMVAGLILGAVLSAMRVYGDPRLRAFSATYVEVIRNTPLLVQLFIVFFGLPSIGIRLDAITAAIIALSINLGAYSTEIVRAGLEAIPRSADRGRPLARPLGRPGLPPRRALPGAEDRSIRRWPASSCC